MVKYIEIIEEVSGQEEVPQMIRLNVFNEIEAEAIYEEQIAKFNGKPTKAQFVEVMHNIDPKKNKPCISKEIKEGKVQK